MSAMRIERLTNGYLIRVDDPKIERANAKRKDGTPWRDPERKFVFPDLDKLLAWIKANADKALPAEDFDTAFDNAALDMEDDDDD